jgi:hypothetical protein
VLVEPEPLDLEPAADERTEPTLGSADLDLDGEPAVRHPPLDDDPMPGRAAAAAMTKPRKGLSARDDEPLALHLSARDDEPDEPAGERLEPALQARALAQGTAGRRGRRPAATGLGKPAPNWGKRLLWGLLTLAAGLLAFQYVWFHFDEMARQDQYRPWFQQICPMVGCQVPTRVDIAHQEQQPGGAQPPGLQGRADRRCDHLQPRPFSQPFPLLELRFADLNGQLIASRRFKPSEYLSANWQGVAKCPARRRSTSPWTSSTRGRRP